MTIKPHRFSVGQTIAFRRLSGRAALKSFEAFEQTTKCDGLSHIFGDLGRAWGHLLHFLRELADENAYRRHLAHHSLSHSAAEWRRFSEKHHNAKYARAKCC